MWSKQPDAGGVKIPKLVQQHTIDRILRHAERSYRGRYQRLEVRFRGALCYIDAYVDAGVSTGESTGGEIEDVPTHLCRLRYFGHEDQWSFSFFTYSNMKYELAVFPDGSFYGTPEDAFDAAAVYL
ncbi:MAG TPA: hypothetical protein VF883_22855 [Thermoanaerobaculia bacterium]